ncbi:MAG: FtsX-like permease family protein [Candidatus Marinimicrobia bacterium]|nr:FtsX-like permease family protein [Candidatus Neomarinimicrobiota bacterium]
MLTLRLAFKNMIGAGLRTWLNVLVLSIAFVAIIATQGLYNGMNKQAIHAMKEMEIAGGQYWHPQYDKYDPLTLSDARSEIPANLQPIIDKGSAVPILISQGTIYPQGRIQSVLINGIPPDQNVLGLPTESLTSGDADLPVLIGSRMAESANLQVGDFVTVRWRDHQGTFDAADAEIVHIMTTQVSSVDNGQLWLPLDRLQDMLGIPGYATVVTVSESADIPQTAGAWQWHSVDNLTADLQKIVQSKSSSAMIFYAFLLFMALLAIFDTQILSLFRRRKEMGTLMSLGMTRGQLIQLFTLEGALHGLLALGVGAIYGIPFLMWAAKTGLSLPDYADDAGMAIGNTIYPSYGAALLLGTTVVVLVTVTIVSYLPTRKITRLKPTDALRGKMS